MDPCADLNLGGAADVPMCEFWAKGHGFDTEFSAFESVSIAHTLGRPIVAAESFTSGDSERWQLYPGALKGQADWALCAGVNRLVFHRYQHQPWLDRAPGMTMGPYGVHWERTQTWWEMVGGFHGYLARCQFLLRRGLPVADICYLAPEGAPHVFRPPRSATRGNPPDRLGYNFDGCSPEVLLNLARVSAGRLVFPGGMSYRVLVLPRFDTMTPPLLRKIKGLVEAGAIVLGAPPRKSPSLSDYPRCDAEVERLAQELWGGTRGEGRGARDEAGGSGLQPSSAALAMSAPGPQGFGLRQSSGAFGTLGTQKRQRTAAVQNAVAPSLPPERRLGKGTVVWDTGAAQAEVVATNTPTPSAALPDIYPDYAAVRDLLARLKVPQDFQAEPFLRYTHRRDGDADIYFVSNPEGRRVEALATFRVNGRQPELWDAITGEQRELPGFAARRGATAAPLRFEPHQSFFVVFRKAAKRRPQLGTNFAELQPVQEIRGPWEVAFEPKRGAPERASFDTLSDWSKHPDPGIRHFSGVATYRTQFEWKARSSRVFLDLGEVQVMAAVKLNGRDLGPVWTAPLRVEATGSLKPGVNLLEIRVANLWPNRLIGDSGLPADQRVAWTTWNPFKKDSPLLPSGLLGPVRLLLDQGSVRD